MQATGSEKSGNNGKKLAIYLRVKRDVDMVEQATTLLNHVQTLYQVDAVQLYCSCGMSTVIYSLSDEIRMGYIKVVAIRGENEIFQGTHDLGVGPLLTVCRNLGVVIVTLDTVYDFSEESFSRFLSVLREPKP